MRIKNKILFSFINRKGYGGSSPENSFLRMQKREDLIRNLIVNRIEKRKESDQTRSLF